MVDCIIDGEPVGFSELQVKEEHVSVPVFGGTLELDPAWWFVDEAGHYHAPTKSNGTLSYPTLRAVEEPYYCHDCHDNHETTNYLCSECGELVSRGSRPGVSSPRIIAGEISHFLFVFDASPERDRIDKRYSVHLLVPPRGASPRRSLFGFMHWVSDDVTIDGGGSTARSMFVGQLHERAAP